ncbi:hypothetical protein EX30DRAFT_383338 [Ascodesmis nigricans]|uniref:Lysine-specific metallo-endopeptidase domain-containing protein n=1 Tax=Ascodesmis nigricans TaxID=341454 RepID=A0A4V3SI61_9PEZI|nr:hypothetical protein EX30DRAFT_383338 [Ascodesmis nigricans]
MRKFVCSASLTLIVLATNISAGVLGKPPKADARTNDQGFIDVETCTNFWDAEGRDPKLEANGGAEWLSSGQSFNALVNLQKAVVESFEWVDQVHDLLEDMQNYGLSASEAQTMTKDSKLNTNAAMVAADRNKLQLISNKPAPPNNPKTNALRISIKLLMKQFFGETTMFEGTRAQQVLHNVKLISAYRGLSKPGSSEKPRPNFHKLYCDDRHLEYDPVNPVGYDRRPSENLQIPHRQKGVCAGGKTYGYARQAWKNDKTPRLPSTAMDIIFICKEAYQLGVNFALGHRALEWKGDDAKWLKSIQDIVKKKGYTLLVQNYLTLHHTIIHELMHRVFIVTTEDATNPITGDVCYGWVDCARLAETNEKDPVKRSSTNADSYALFILSAAMLKAASDQEKDSVGIIRGFNNVGDILTLEYKGAKDEDAIKAFEVVRKKSNKADPMWEEAKRKASLASLRSESSNSQTGANTQRSTSGSTQAQTIRGQTKQNAAGTKEKSSR